MSADLEWTAGGLRSRRYGDIYFSEADGLAETRAVFLAGCGLPGAWAGRSRFTVAELGFGTGLNIAALLHLWKATSSADAHLSIFSVEAHPLAREDAARALGAWPELADSACALLAAWPDGRRGFHRLDLDGHRATVDLYVGEAAGALRHWSGRADAWFLDGFAPSRNPEMWREEVLAAVGRLSAPQARLASFTVAGQVRRGLAAAAFEVAKRPGFGAKAERLEARFKGAASAPPASRPPPRSVAIIGAGIAGAALARAFSRQGVACAMVEAGRPGAGASGNPAALVTPRFDAGFGPSADLHAQAFAYAVAAYRREAPQALIAEGALQLATGQAARDRFARLAAWDGFRPAGLKLLSEDEAALPCEGECEGGPIAALRIVDALVIDPAAALRTWLEGCELIEGEVADLQPTAEGWLCRGGRGQILAEAEAVCLAAGFDTAVLLPSAGLQPVRGQAEYATAPVFTGEAAAWGAYAIPTRDGGVLFGASHRRGDANRDVRPDERLANLDALAERRPALAERVRALPAEALRSRAAVRAATRDHLPLAGGWGSDGLHLLSGLGGRGFTLAPLLAEHIAAEALGAPSPLPTSLARRLRPDRFAAENRNVGSPFP